MDNRKVSIYKGVTDTKGVIYPLEHVINRIKSGDKGLAKKTKDLNEWFDENPVKYKERKEELPAVTWSGEFPSQYGHRLGKHLVAHSGLIVLDVDNDINMESVLADFAQNPHVFFAFISPSGKGIKPVIPVSPIPQNKNEHAHAFDAVLDVFFEYADQDPEQLPKQRDPNRLCFLAHDPLAIYNPQAIPIEWEIDEAEEQRSRESENAPTETYGDVSIEQAKHVLSFVPRDLSYAEWRNVGMGIKQAGLPVSVFSEWSHNQRLNSSGVWVSEDCLSHWNRYNSQGITWGSVVHIAKQNGYVTPTRATAKLQRNTDAEPNPTETLEANRENREQAADIFMEAETDTLHILLVKDSTGTGKSHTIILKSKQHDKRTLAQLPHTDLASQAVSIAWEHGYTSPYHLLGRGHNWGDSGIAEIPIENRTADLFEKNNCIMCDCVEEYTKKRLAPRTFCEHRCGFRDDCLHLSQYEGLGDRDFVASCTPNLLFDLNMRGYLQSLVTATDEPSDEDYAIDAILGTESEATENFDFAILDDYGINALYTDISLRQSEFKTLKKAWKDTPTADFATLVLKVFEKKKPHKIVKALRNAYESTADWHTDISDALTQHARIGIVEKAERSKSSKESKRLLAEKQIRFVDGGTQFIPVDWDAYKELTDKGIPSVNCNHLETEEIGEHVRIPHTPTHALIAGVSVQDLTPIWQKGATPIELLDIFLSSIGNDKNAPIHRTFRAGDPPEAVLTFSIPPQAPIGVLPQIAMLSATTNPADTQRAFDGQAVRFSVHEGGHLEWADGVEVYQFQDARLTAASVFDYPLTADGKRKLQDAPLGLTATAEKRLAKLNDWAKTIDGVTAFISYKEFTQEGTLFAEAVNGFDEVKHFHEIEGLNFDGLKFLVVFGYPKALHESITEQARKQYASDSDPLPKADPNLRDEKGNPISEYLQLTETAEYQEKGNLTITESRYTDARLEKIRKQWATEKLEQAIGRARFSRWTDTTTLIFTDTPIPQVSDRSTLFSGAAFNLTESANGLSDAMDRIAQAEATGDVKAVMETKGVSERTARHQTQETRKQSKAELQQEALTLYAQGQSFREIGKALNKAPNTIKSWCQTAQF